MQTSKNIFYFLTAAGLFLLLKFGYTLADNNDLIILLKPTDKFIGFLTGSHSIYLAEIGYYHQQMNLIIDKSCSGFNFWILCFLIFTHLTVKYFEKTLDKILSIPIALIGAYLLTIFVNTSRIFASIIVQSRTKNILPDYQQILHEAIGIITNLTFLILAYIFIEKILILKRPNAKLA